MMSYEQSFGRGVRNSQTVACIDGQYYEYHMCGDGKKKEEKFDFIGIGYIYSIGGKEQKFKNSKGERETLCFFKRKGSSVKMSNRPF